MRYGAGVKGKVLEAMSFGLPVVTTSVGAEGILIEHGVSGFVAGAEADLVDALERAYTDEALWHRVRKEAYELVRREYSEESFRKCVRELLEG